MSMLRRARPLVEFPDADPVKYYARVARYMMKVIEERRLAAIVQKNSDVRLVRSIRYKSGIRRPIIVTKDSQIPSMAKRGVVDIMFSVTKIKEELPDVFVVDIKADKYVWIHENNWYIFDLVVQIVCNFLKYMDIDNYIVCFDGMNGYKVITLLDVDNAKSYVKDRQQYMKILSKCIELLKDVAVRVAKHYKSVYSGLDLFSHMLISGNTTLKIGLCRVPFSLHWSTKLVALPLQTPVREFSVMKALPSRVIDKAENYGQVIEQRWRYSKVDKLIKTIEECMKGQYVEHVYKAKAYIMSHISLES